MKSFSSCKQVSGNADLIIYNANIWTGDQNNPHAEAIAVSKGKILAIGENNILSDLRGESTEIIDAGGKFMTPGFIDSHVHFLTAGMNLSSVQLRDARTPEEFINRIAAYAETLDKGTWILGGDWDHENWGGQLPDKTWIDKVTSENPVFIRRLDGHMGLANSLALEMAGIEITNSNIEGGEIIIGNDGSPSGIFKDNAMNLVLDVIPPPTSAQFDAGLHAAMQYVAARGVTSIHYMAGTDVPGYMETFERAHSNGTLITRVYVFMPITDWELCIQKVNKEGKGDEWLKIGGLKGFMDGSLGSHTALFKEPYTDQPDDKGISITPPDSILRWTSEAEKAGLQVAIHAIGDEAIASLLDIFEKVQSQTGRKDQRFRIEHAQHIAPGDIGRFKQLEVIPSMQPYHAIDDGRWAEKVIGPERIKTTYAFRSLFDAGANVAFGSDWFVAPPTPLEGIYAAVTRRTLDSMNPDGWVPEQKITVEQALQAYTANAAFASFDENTKGTLETGKLADFVILDEDITKISPEKIREVKVLQTFVGGKMVFDYSGNY